MPLWPLTFVMDLDWGFIAIVFVFSFPTTVVLLTVDSVYLGNQSVNVSALNRWVLSLLDWLLLNKSFYFSRLSVVSSFSLTLFLYFSPPPCWEPALMVASLGLAQTPSNLSILPCRTLACGASHRLPVRARYLECCWG